MSSGTKDDRARRPKVLSEDWEDALRAGQASEGLAGSVEPELAIVHLLRHARAPEGLDDARLDAVWADIDGAIEAQAPRPWWRRPWTWIGTTAAAAAAAAVVLVIVLPQAPSTDRTVPELAKGEVDDGAAEGGETTPAASRAAALERQFQILAPKARKRVAAAVDVDRDRLRDRLLATALKSDGEGSQGGAP